MSLANNTPLRFSDFTLELRPSRLRKGRTPIPLPSQPLRLLTLLVTHAGEVVSHKEIQQHVWGELQVDFAGGTHVCIGQIRKALGDDGLGPKFIETVPGRGYRFVAAVTGTTVSAETPPAPRRQLAWIAGASLLVMIAIVTSYFLSQPGVEPSPGDTTPIASEDAYLRGRELLSSGSEVDAKLSRPFFAAAIEAKPNFAPSYAAMASAYEHTRDYQQARNFAEQATTIDRTYAEGYLRLAAAQAYGEWDWPAAEENIKRALALVPGRADASLALATVYMVTGRAQLSLELMTERLAQDPKSAGLLTEYGTHLYYAGDFDLARKQCAKALEIDGESIPARECLYRVAVIGKDYGVAVTHALELMAELASSDEIAAVANMPAKRGVENFESWRVALPSARAKPAPIDPLQSAYSLAALRQYDDAYYYLLQARDLHYAMTPLATFDPVFIPIRHQSKYLEMLAGMGVVESAATTR